MRIDVLSVTSPRFAEKLPKAESREPNAARAASRIFKFGCGLGPRYEFQAGWAVYRCRGKLRIGLATATPAGTRLDAECKRATEDAAKLCESLGQKVDEARAL